MSFLARSSYSKLVALLESVVMHVLDKVLTEGKLFKADLADPWVSHGLSSQRVKSN